jgi:bacterioferritin (cytochrome b1)
MGEPLSKNLLVRWWLRQELFALGGFVYFITLDFTNNMTHKDNKQERSVGEIMKKYDGLENFALTANPECSVSIYDAIKEDLQAERKKREEAVEVIKTVLNRHSNWKPTCGHESEEEKGFQKGLVAEAKLIEKEILQALTQPNNHE